MARRSQSSSAGDNPLDPNYLPPHYREEYRLAIDALVEEDLEGYYNFLQKADVVGFLSIQEIKYIQSSVQDPQKSHHPEHPEQHILDTGGDGSSDTYWPIHSDLDVPGLDLGWPQIHHFIGPTEVTTLVNPPEPNMPSIKDQARRLIKNAQQVIAVVMDMFTDIDMFADILNAAMRNVAVYIILDEQNAHHFGNMVANCRVNLQNIQFLRVRTVPGITYHCRSGKSFKGQMMDRFLLTDCRAVLSGNYSFMWSFEKLHRCMAHLFLGQLVSTFDEEFRILFAQSQPLMIENVLLPMEEFNLLQKTQYPSERASLYKDSRKLLSLDTGRPEEWRRHSFDERMDVDWRMMALQKQDSLHGPSDMYRFPSQLPSMDPSFDQGHSRMPMSENPAFKRNSYAEGGHGRFSSPFIQQQGMPETENQGRQFLRGQQVYHGPGPGPEVEYSGYDKFTSQNYPSADQYSEPPYNFDPVFNYLSSTKNVDFDPGSDKLLPAADLPFSSSHPRRLSLGQPYACQTSPTTANPPEQSLFYEDPNSDRKDPRVKRGLRNLRISSYLCAYDNPEDEELPSGPLKAPDPVEEPSYPIQQTTQGIDLSAPKIPNVREFKVPAVPRASQMPSYAKITAREQPKKVPDESNVNQTKITPRPSDSSSTAEGGKGEEAEQKEPKTSILRRDDSFRRKYNPATPRSSRLRSSLIFSSLEQQHSQDPKTASGQQEDEEGDKNEARQTKLPFASQVSGQRKSGAREPMEWSRFIKSATIDDSATETSKLDSDNSQADDKDTSKERNSKVEVQESDVDQANSSPSMPRPKPSKVELPINVKPPKSLLTTPSYVDMSDPDKRLMFFKEMAAKRKAALAAEAGKKKDKAPLKPPTDLKGSDNAKVEESELKEIPEMIDKAKSVEAEKSKETALIIPTVDLINNITVKNKVPKLKENAAKSVFESLLEENATVEDAGKSVSIQECESTGLSNASHKTGSPVQNDPSTSQTCGDKELKNLTESEDIWLSNTQLETSLPVSGKNESPQIQPPEEPKLSKPALKDNSPSHAPIPTDDSAAKGPSHVQGTGESKSPRLDSTSQESSSLTPISVDVPPSSASAGFGSKTPNSFSVELDTGISSPLLPPEHRTRSSNPLIQTTPAETTSFNVSADDSTSTLTSIILSSNNNNTETQEAVQLSLQESSISAEETCEILTGSESTQVHPDPVCQLSSSNTPSEVPSVPVESDICHDTVVAGLEQNTSSSHSTTNTNSEEACDPTQDEDLVEKEPEVPGSPTDVKSEGALSSLLSESGLLKVCGVENSVYKPDQGETVTSTPNPADLPAEHVPSEVSIPGNPDTISSSSQSEITASLQATPPSELTGLDSPAHAETVPCSSILESVGSVLSREAKRPEINLTTVHSPSDTNCNLQQIITNSHVTPVFPSTKTSVLTELTSEVPTEPDVLCRTSESEIPEVHTLETTVPAKSKLDNQCEINNKPELSDPGEKKPEDTEAENKVTQESISSEKTSDPAMQNNCSEPAEITSEEVVPLSPQSKLPNSSQSRYHSSTVNVLSSSNLRDDTKLLLEQISANSQSRNEANKEAPVTDDEKEDEADKIAKREKELRIGTSNKGQPKSTQEREKLLERIQSMRKERKVYSRFEV
ncbi:protein FAM83H [Channa argus]|uniref:protein FAM83H n=1 Tax=Channa argus TaxID=215402 RepID=UPI002944F6AC|nr:hypothetical protein Q8A73_001590 [Channa argus]